MFNNFFYLLMEYGVPVSMQYVMDFCKGLEKGIVNDLDELFLFARLIFCQTGRADGCFSQGVFPIFL